MRYKGGKMWEEIQYNLKRGEKVKTLLELVNEGFTPMHSLEKEKWDKLNIEQQEIVLLRYTGKKTEENGIREIYICEHEREFDHLMLVIFFVK